MALCAENEQTARVTYFLRLGSYLLLVLVVQVNVLLSCGEYLLIIGLGEAGGFVDKLVGNALLAHIGFGEIFGVAAQHDIRAASSHIGGYGDSALLARLSYDLGFTLVVLRVEHLMLDAFLFEHFGKLLGLFYRYSADQNGLTLFVALLYLSYGGNEFAMLVLIHLILTVDTDNGLVGGYFDNVKAVDAAELRFLCHSRAGHTGKLAVQTEEVLEGDSGEGLALVLYLHSLLGFDSLMKSLVEAASEHQSSGELVNYDDLSVLHDVLDIEVHTAVSLYCLIDVVENGEVIGIHKVLDTEEFFSLLYAVGEKRGGLCLFIDDIIGGVIVLLFLGIHLDHLHGGHGLGELVRLFVEVGRLVAASRDDERSSRLIYEDRVHLVHDSEIHLAHYLVLLADTHIVAQVVEAELIVRAVGYIAGVCRAAVVVLHIVDNKPDGQPEEAVNASDKLAVALGEVVVDGDNVNTLAGQRVEV